MTFRQAYVLILLLTGIVASGCESRKEPADSPTPAARPIAATPEVKPVPGSSIVPATPAQLAKPATTPRIPFREVLPPALYELPSGALATWRDTATDKPALVIFSAGYYLSPIPQDFIPKIRKLVLTAPAEEIVRRGSRATPDPLLTSEATISAAIASDLFSEIIFVRPYLKEDDDVVLQRFRRIMTENGLLTAAESDAATFDHGIISGSVRGVPFRCLPAAKLPKAGKPMVLHIDLGYFKAQFVNEIKTPLYALIHDLATAVRDSARPALNVTLSYSNQEYELSLETRFIINTLADLLRKPKLLEGGEPASWGMRSRALYLSNMFAEEEARSIIEKEVVASPNDPAAHFDLAMLRFQQDRPLEGFTALDRAVALDKGYALAYLQLAERGFAMGKPETSLQLLDKAARVFPDNPFIPLNKAHILLLSGRGRDALPLVRQLRKEPWSDPQIVARLEEMEAVAQQAPPPPSPQPAGKEASAGKPKQAPFHMPLRHH